MASPFSGTAGRKAAVATMTYLDGVQKTIDKQIKTNKTASLKDLNTGYKNAYGSMDQAYSLYQPYADTGLKAFNAYADATGANGQEGYDRSVGSFRASPGYEWQRDQGTDAVARKASALGALGSGNTMTAIADYSSHLADQEYGSYLDRLNNVAQYGYNATGQQAGILQNKGGLQAQQGRDRSGVRQGYTTLGASTLQNTGALTADALKGGMLAGQNAAANRWGAGMGLLNTLAGFAGSSTGAKLFGLA